MALLTQERILSQRPDRMIVRLDGLKTHEARTLALAATTRAQRNMPKVTGAAARNLRPVYGPGFFGVRWVDRYVWFVERGTSPFTMRKLAGKVIPMWINDPTGAEARKNPKAKKRTTADGRAQVLIFRRAAKIGEQRTVRRKDPLTGQYVTKTVPKHYPGAPGRISRREAPQPYTTPGKRGGAIAAGNIGVWWRHPGITARETINMALTITVQKAGIVPNEIIVGDSGWRG